MAMVVSRKKSQEAISLLLICAPKPTQSSGKVAQQGMSARG